MIRAASTDVQTLVEIIEYELRGIKDGEASKFISETVSKAAETSGADADSVCNVLYWLTESGPNARQTILVQTLESLLNDPSMREIGLSVLSRISSPENVDIMLKYVDRGVLTLSQAIFVLLYPDSSSVLND